MNCTHPIQTINGLGQCRKCAACLKRKRKHWLGRFAAEAFTSKQTRFVTLTYDDEHVSEGRSLPKSHIQSYVKAKRRFYGFKHFAVGEYGEQTDRPHWHMLQFIPGPTLASDPLGVSQNFKGWTHGKSMYEKPRSVAGSASYVYDYLDKGGYALQPSPGLGKTYLLRWARLMAQNKRRLCGQYGMEYHVPGVNTPKGDPWVYIIAPGHHFAPAMAETYILEYFATWGRECDLSQFEKVHYDGSQDDEI